MTKDPSSHPGLAWNGDRGSPVSTIAVLEPDLRNRIDTAWRSEIGGIHLRKGARDGSNRERTEAGGSGPSTCRRLLPPGSGAVPGEIISPISPNSGGAALKLRRRKMGPRPAASDSPST